MHIDSFVGIWIYSMWNYDYGHNIMRTFDVLPNFAFTTNETKADCQ